MISRAGGAGAGGVGGGGVGESAASGSIITAITRASSSSSAEQLSFSLLSSRVPSVLPASLEIVITACQPAGCAVRSMRLSTDTSACAAETNTARPRRRSTA
jgi:hypothetical protein